MAKKKKTCMAKKPEMFEININEDIVVRLTKEGKRVYKAYRQKYRYNPIKNINGGWAHVALWEFMYIFGPRMFMGAETVIVGNKIRILKPLKEV